MLASKDAVLHRGMLIAKSLLCDLTLGPYCTNYIGAKWSVFSYTVTYTDPMSLSDSLALSPPTHAHSTSPPLHSTSPYANVHTRGHTSRNVRGTAVTPYNNDALFFFWHWTHVHHVCAPCTSIMAHWPHPIACVLPMQKWVGRVFPWAIHCRSLYDYVSEYRIRNW